MHYNMDYCKLRRDSNSIRHALVQGCTQSNGKMIMSKKTRKANKPAVRPGFKFWLDSRKQEEADLIAFIAWLKATRQFSKAVRDGLRLIWTLGQGDTTVLMELFPAVVQKLQPDYSELVATFQAMVEKGGASVPATRTLPPRIPQPVQPPIVQEVDTSEAFLNAF